MKLLNKKQMILIQGGLRAPVGCSATATCSNGKTVTASGGGEGSNCDAVDSVNANNNVGYACYHPANSGTSTCSYC